MDDKSKPFIQTINGNAYVKYGDYYDLQQQHNKLLSDVRSLFKTIKHGDDEHQKWLKDAIEKHFYTIKADVL